jgi:hypothetical protein
LASRERRTDADDAIDDTLQEIIMLSGEALDLAFALRDEVGADLQGAGPDGVRLRTLTRLTDDKLAAAMHELESVGFIAVQRDADPAHANAVIGVIVLAPLQIYLDDLERQDIED